MPSAANVKSEKPASAEATDNSPIRQITTIIEHKIRNLEKRKSKLTSYRDLQKAGKELNSDQKIAVAKYDEVAYTLEFTRDLSKQIAAVVTSAEREAKKQAKKEAWVRYAADTNKIREVLLILDCLTQMGDSEVRDDFLNGVHGAVKLTEEDLKILDNLYPEVTPKHEVNEEGQPAFHTQAIKAAEHLYAIIDGKPKEILGTTYTRIKEIIGAIHGCGYFDRSVEEVVAEAQEVGVVVEEQPPVEEVAPPELVPFPTAGALPVPPAAAVVPPPAYPLRPPPITLQEVEHAYFAQQYPQQRPIAEVIGSQNFFFLQESEIDSPVGTPHPPPIPDRPSPPAPIPTQTFTNQHFVQLPGGRGPETGALPMPPQPHFPPHPDHAAFPPAPMALAGAPAPLPPAHAPMPHPVMAPAPAPAPAPASAPIPQPITGAPGYVAPIPMPVPAAERRLSATPPEDKIDDEWKGSQSPEREEGGHRKAQGDTQHRYRRYGRGPSNGHRGRGVFQGARQGGDGYRGRHGGDYQHRGMKDGYQSRQYDGYQNRHSKESYHNRGGDDGYYGNGDATDGYQQNERENGGRDRYGEGPKGRGRGGPRGGTRGGPRPPRPHHYTRRVENAD